MIGPDNNLYVTIGDASPWNVTNIDIQEDHHLLMKEVALLGVLWMVSEYQKVPSLVLNTLQVCTMLMV